jgi:hypothetical protein
MAGEWTQVKPFECGGTAVASCRKPKAAFENRVVKVLCLRILRSTLPLVAHG